MNSQVELLNTKLACSHFTSIQLINYSKAFNWIESINLYCIFNFSQSSGIMTKTENQELRKTLRENGKENEKLQSGNSTHYVLCIVIP